MAALMLVAATSLGADVGPDVSVGWISRSPRIPYVWGSENPATEGWPAPGETVTWTAHVRNLTGRNLSGVGYRWILDGRVVGAGESSLPQGESKFELPWSWTFERHELEFEIDGPAEVDEIEERNNSLLIHTNALAVGFYVEQTFWNSIRTTVTIGNIGATTFDDWMQKRIRQFNSMAELARYPETPDGVLDRWRIDQIHVVPDGALPLVTPGPEVRDWGADESSWSTIYPDSSNLTVDMEWGFPTSTLGFYIDRVSWTLLYDSLVHELGHARYLIDVYAWNVDVDRDVVTPVPEPPSGIGWYFTTPEPGMMNTSWGFIDRYSAIAMNRIAGHRATMGHYNE
ncbi:MAG: hypothetical protein NDJ92_16050, partial [Thermoanaerobaculia bacterium]|nr:hypothetical protein [Thermoanaerobaculia bacterium]